MGILTKLENLPIYLRRIKERKRKDSKSCVKTERHLPKCRLRHLGLLHGKYKEIGKMEEMVPPPSLYREKDERENSRLKP